MESSSIFIFIRQEQFRVINLILPKSTLAAKPRHILAPCISGSHSIELI